MPRPRIYFLINPSSWIREFPRACRGNESTFYTLFGICSIPLSCRHDARKLTHTRLRYMHVTRSLSGNHDGVSPVYHSISTDRSRSTMDTARLSVLSLETNNRRANLRDDDSRCVHVLAVDLGPSRRATTDCSLLLRSISCC